MTLREGEKLWLKWITLRYGKREAKEAKQSGFLSWTDNGSPGMSDIRNISKQEVFKAYIRFVDTIDIIDSKG